MHTITIDKLRLWQFEILQQQPGVKHFVSGRASFTNGPEFTLSFSSSPDRDFIRHNRQQLASALGIDHHRLVFPSQVHKTRVVRVTPETSTHDVMETDALITSEIGMCIAVMSADCVPILLYDKKHHVAGAVHAGWRGTVARILEITLAAMKDNFGTEGKDLIAGIGPSVCQQSYEVGEEVVHEVHKAFGHNSGLLMPQANQKARLDLWKANMLQLREFGVPDAQIEVSGLCTVINNADFFSARKGDSGRFAAGIMLT